MKKDDCLRNRLFLLKVTRWASKISNSYKIVALQM